MLCSKVPKAIQKAKSKIETFSPAQYTQDPCGAFMVTEAQAQQGYIIVEENQAQDMCYDAWEMEEGSVGKLKKILATLNHFPLSTEGWGNLGHFYHYEVKSHRIYRKECATEALKMYDTAIQCARILNPTWTMNRTEELWGDIDNRPYLRAISARARALKDIGNVQEAAKQAKMLLRWNPGDNQGMRKLLCTWYLENNNTEGCSNLLRKFNTNDDMNLAYTDVLLQYLLWKKDDAVEKEVQQALFVALQRNSHVPDVLTGKKLKEIRVKSYSPGSLVEAKLYCQDARKLWKKYPESLEWLASQKYIDGQKKPTEAGVISLLRSGLSVSISCKHTN